MCEAIFKKIVTKMEQSKRREREREEKEVTKDGIAKLQPKNVRFAQPIVVSVSISVLC